MSECRHCEEALQQTRDALASLDRVLTLAARERHRADRAIAFAAEQKLLCQQLDEQNERLVDWNRRMATDNQAMVAKLGQIGAELASLKRRQRIR